MKGLNRKPYWYPIARSFADSVQIHSGATLELNAFSPAFCQQLAAGKSDLDCVGLCSNQRVYTALSQAKGTTLNITFRTNQMLHHICYPKPLLISCILYFQIRSTAYPQPRRGPSGNDE